MKMVTRIIEWYKKNWVREIIIIGLLESVAFVCIIIAISFGYATSYWEARNDIAKFNYYETLSLIYFLFALFLWFVAYPLYLLISFIIRIFSRSKRRRV